jgi:hypothetical protein
LYIVLGGWKNTASGVICNSKNEWERYPSPKVLSTSEEREFYVSFANDLVEVGLVGEDPFISHKLECHVDVKYIGIATGWGGKADWTFCGYGKWLYQINLTYKYIFECHKIV